MKYRVECITHTDLLQHKHYGVPSLQDLMPVGLWWSCNINEVYNICNALEFPWKKTVHGKIVIHKTGTWCRKSWRSLYYMTIHL